MAEISYPFSQANASGGTDMVSQTQWQKLAAGHGDRIDFRLTAPTYATGALPFSARVVGRSVEIAPGRAQVGGFAYELDAPLAVPVAANAASVPRRDTIVLRADLPKGSVNLAVVQGQPGVTPVAPQPQRELGQVWEMVLYEVAVPASNGAVSVLPRLQFGAPPVIGSPWNTAETAQFTEPNAFLYDLDVNGDGSQAEHFRGRDGLVVTRDLGKSRTFTTVLGGTSAAQVPDVDRVVRWRWIAPGVVHFGLRISNRSSAHIDTTDGAWHFTVALPQPVSGIVPASFSGFLENTNWAGEVPYMSHVTGTVWWNGSSTLHLFTPNRVYPSMGLDGLNRIPAGANLYLSGTYEASIFN
ncbi:hypothetical protein ACIRBX_12000 [Kitasatospora sp. NPDC096147]|uniref:hypothetical protein n=1 Tax=Kitasatospora sp. NPDC096147 TaxID=3364093 RepID=UPI00382396CF